MLNIEKYKDDILNTHNADLSCCVLSEILKLDCVKDCSECKKHAIEWLLEEYKEPILDDAERKYLTAVIKPFREKIKYIRKNKSAYKDKQQFISIGFYDDDYMYFPYLDDDTMYKGMKENKKYSLEELDL